jgi:hypothetical protein
MGARALAAVGSTRKERGQSQPHAPTAILSDKALSTIESHTEISSSNLPVPSVN